MTAAHHVNSIGGSSYDGDGAATVLVMARWLRLAAAPTFAIMALATRVLGGAPIDSICSAGHGSLLSGMIPKYLLMSAFHSAPLLRLIASRRSG
jgi:hypothetical protein